MGLLYVITSNGIDDAKEKTAKAQAEQQVAAARIGQLQAYGDFASVKTARENAVKGVADSRFDYERLMREVALVLPHDSYLTAFSSAPAGTTEGTTGGTTSTGPTVALAGCAPSQQGVATALVQLLKLHNLADVNLTSSSRAGAAATGTASGCPVAWVGSLTLTPETAPTQPTPVPARLGGGQ